MTPAETLTRRIRTLIDKYSLNVTKPIAAIAEFEALIESERLARSKADHRIFLKEAIDRWYGDEDRADFGLWLSSKLDAAAEAVEKETV